MNDKVRAIAEDLRKSATSDPYTNKQRDLILDFAQRLEVALAGEQKPVGQIISVNETGQPKVVSHIYPDANVKAGDKLYI